MPSKVAILQIAQSLMSLDMSFEEVFYNIETVPLLKDLLQSCIKSNICITKLPINKNTLYYWINGTNIPSKSSLKKLQKIIDLSFLQNNSNDVCYKDFIEQILFIEDIQSFTEYLVHINKFISHLELAEILGVSSCTIRNWLNGSNKPRASTLEAIKEYILLNS